MKLMNRLRVMRGNYLNELSAGEERLLEKSVKEWMHKIFSKRQIDKKRFEAEVRSLYRRRSLDMPKMMYVDSPLDLQFLTRRIVMSGSEQVVQSTIFEEWADIEDTIRERVSDGLFKRVQVAFDPMRRAANLLLRHLENEFGEFYEDVLCDGSLAARWCATTDFFRRIGIIRSRSLQQYADFEMNSGVFMSVYLRLHVVACPAPIKAYFNRERMLHQDGAAAMRWIDNFSVYAMNGVLVPKDIVLKRSKELDASLIISEENGGIRRELVRKIGLDRVLKELNAKAIDAWGSYQLLELDVPRMFIRPRYLKMLNPSIGTWHVEGVPPEISTCRQALAWRDSDIDDYVIPAQLT